MRRIDNGKRGRDRRQDIKVCGDRSDVSIYIQRPEKQATTNIGREWERTNGRATEGAGDNMIDGERLIQQLTIDEGLRLRPYNCSSGKLTIGIGRNIEDIGITEEEAKYLLSNDLTRTYLELKANFDWFDYLNSYRQEVLMNMCFNLGISRLKTFRLMLAAVEMGDFHESSKQMMDSRWARQVGERAKRLSRVMNGEDRTG